MGCEAAPNPDTEYFQENCSAFTGAASQPNAGQACSLQEKVAAFKSCVDIYAAMAVYQANHQKLADRYRGQARSHRGFALFSDKNFTLRVIS